MIGISQHAITCPPPGQCPLGWGRRVHRPGSRSPSPWPQGASATAPGSGADWPRPSQGGKGHCLYQGRMYALVGRDAYRSRFSRVVEWLSSFIINRS